MLAAMNVVPAKAGQVVFVPAGTPHAIGPGVMLTELQEPTSFSVLAEHSAFGVGEDAATLGLGWDLALSCFDLRGRQRDPRRAHRRAEIAGISPLPATTVPARGC